MAATAGVSMRIVSFSLFLIFSLSLASQGADYRSLAEWGDSFSPPAERIECKIPSSAFRKLPKQVPLYARAETTSFPPQALDWILERAFSKTNEFAEQKARIASNPQILSQGKTVINRDAHSFLVISPESGSIHFFNRKAAEFGSQALTNSSKLLDKTKMTKEFRDLFAQLNLNPGEIEKNVDGKENLVFRDTESFPPPQRLPVITQRQIYVQRQLNGCPLLNRNAFHEILLAKTISGEWAEMRIHWPKLNVIGSLPITPRSNPEFQKLIGTRKLFWDKSNQANWTDAKKIVITGIRVAYLEAAGSSKLMPLFLLDTELKGVPEADDYAVILMPIEP
ncbi:MAG: hypothetical protein ACK4UN_13255 [Limisphaerales bacterium]